MLESDKTNMFLAKEPSKNGYIPWASLLFSVFLFYVLGCNLDFNFPLNALTKELIGHPTHLQMLALCTLLIYVLDFTILMRRRNQTEEDIAQLKQLLTNSWKQKNKQQIRANTYSDHTDKLKSFISDKLIDYMDFDEKFIHFKGIASEVRHNGVISYDKINIALNRAIEQQHFLAIYEQEKEDTVIDSQTKSSLFDYQSAKEAIAYLWDLLDLSTAENMSLYIGKKLIDYEENYFQMKLSNEQENEKENYPTSQPTFFPLQSLLMSMKLIIDSDKIKHRLVNANINSQLFKQPFHYEDDHFVVTTNVTSELLGNSNHVVLLLENLIKNAQFFSHKVKIKQDSDRIRVLLTQSEPTENSYQDKDKSETLDDVQIEPQVKFSIYNRGQNINEDHFDKIFELGYTTRRKKDFHGRGLGLYFVHEIVKGYQGTIKAHNIHYKPLSFEILLTLVSGDEHRYSISCELIDGKVITSTLDEKIVNQNKNELSLSKDIPIEYFQIINQDSLTHYSSTAIDYKNQKGNKTWTDDDSALPLWQVSLTPYKKKQTFTFKALDITGVRFDVNIPSVIE